MIAPRKIRFITPILLSSIFMGIFLFGSVIFSSAVAAPWWSQSVNVESKVGTDRSIQSLDVMYPLSHSKNSLTFTDLRGRIDDDRSVELNLGLAHRSVMDDPLAISSEAVLGYYGFADRLESQYDNTFYQATGGFEYFTEKYSLRVNGYWPENDAEKSFLSYHGTATGTQLFIDERQNYERPLPGYDVELGRTVRFDGWQLYGRGSYFRFHHSDVAEVEGSRFRAGMQLDGSHPDVYLPEDSQLTLGMEWQDDRVREEQTFGVVRLRVPFGTIEDQKSKIENKPSGVSHQRSVKNSEPSTLNSELRSWQKDRLTERIERDVDIVTARVDQQDVLSTEPAVLSSTGDTMGTVAVAAAGAGGSGNVQDPTDLATAVDQAGTDGTVFLVDSGGVFSTNGETIPGGQSVFGGSARLVLETPDGRGRTTFRLGGGRPVITNGDTSTSILTLRKGTSGHRIAGLTLEGGYNSIEGENLSDLVVRNVKTRDSYIYPLYLNNTTDATIRNFTVNGSRGGIILENLSNSLLTGVEVNSTIGSGIRLNSPGNVTIRSVEARDIGPNANGLWVSGGKNITISDVFAKNTGYDGVVLDGENITADSITVVGAEEDGVDVSGSSIRVSDITVRNTRGTVGSGIEVSSGNDVTVDGFEVDSVEEAEGLLVYDAENVDISAGSIRSADTGLAVENSHSVNFNGITVENTGQSGVHLLNSSDTVTFRDITIRDAKNGVTANLKAELLLPSDIDGMRDIHFGPNFEVKGPITGSVFRSPGTEEKLIDPSGTIIAPNPSCRIEGTVTGSTLTLAGPRTKAVTSGNCP